jgi:hypothetical protein
MSNSEIKGFPPGTLVIAFGQLHFQVTLLIANYTQT